MRRSYKRTRLRWAPILWLLLIANIAAGLVYSPLTSIRRVRVTGAEEWDKPRLAVVLSDLKGVPCALVNRASIESKVMALQDVSGAHLTRNIFGSAVLSVSYRKPVARLAERLTVALAADGTLYPSSHIPEGVPTVQLPRGHPIPMFTLAGDWQSVGIAALAAKVRQLDVGSPIRIELKSGGTVCLNMSAGQVILGSCEDLDTKLRVLKQRLHQDPAYLSSIGALDLTVPSSPLVVPKQPGVPR